MDLLKKMLSIPPTLPLTSTQRFSFISAFIAYFIMGLTMTFAPDLWNMLLLLDFSAGGRGLFILVGSGVAVIGLCIIVLARNQASQVPGAGALLGTVFNRLVIVNAFCVRFYMQGLLNLRFTGMISVLDTVLALLTYVIWMRENPGASLIKFFQDIWAVLNPFSPRPTRYTMFQLLGFVHVIVSFTAPSMLMFLGVVPSTIEGRHAEGLFRAYFFIWALHGIFQVLAAGSQNDSYPIAAVFYRLVWNVPVFLVLGLTGQIYSQLAKFLIVYDAAFVICTLVLFATAKSIKAT